MTDFNKIKSRQAKHFEDSWKQATEIQYEGNHYHDYFRRMPFLSAKRMLDSQNITLNSKTVLVASCGTGIDIHYLRKFYTSRFIAADISENAVRVTTSLNPEVEGQVADTEVLPYADNSFDFVFVASSLHHLPRPMIGIYELLRVARFGIICMEPNDSWLMRISTQIGLATETEDAGNYVYRFSGWDVYRFARAQFLKCYVVCLFAIHRVARNRLEFIALKLLNAVANLLFPQLGNHIVFFIQKVSDSPR